VAKADAGIIASVERIGGALDDLIDITPAHGTAVCSISDADDATRDAGLISAVQRVKHYEIASYGTARAHAQTLNESDVASLLETTLNEEAETDKKLTALAEQQVNAEAASKAS